MSRQIIVVDVETTGLDVEVHVPVEIAWVNLATGESDCFIPPHTSFDLDRAEAVALEINGYQSRIAGGPRKRGTDVRILHALLEGRTLAGSNPAFDAAMLRGAFKRWRAGAGDPWHHRLLDLSPYAAGVLGINPSELPGLHTVCELLDVENEAPHTAMGDAQATAECFRRLLAVR